MADLYSGGPRGEFWPGGQPYRQRFFSVPSDKCQYGMPSQTMTVSCNSLSKSLLTNHPSIWDSNVVFRVRQSLWNPSSKFICMQY